MPKNTSDEKKFSVDVVYNRQNECIWAVDRQQADILGGIIVKDKFPASFVVWLGVCMHGTTRLVVYSLSSVNGKSYAAKALHVARAYVYQVFGGNWWIQQDGASAHTARGAQNWCACSLHHFIPKQIWPPNSPDLNPLEDHVCNVVVLQMNWNNIVNKPYLVKEIRGAVRQIDVVVVKKCMSSRKTVVFQVLDNCSSYIARVLFVCFV